jgi:signal transduction histidine kinase/PAS domain-containing protein
MQLPEDHPRAPDVQGMRLVLDHLPDLAAVYDQQWRWLYLNGPAEALLRALGVAPDALAGRRPWDVFPDDPHRAQYESAMSSLGEVVFEARYPQLGRVLETRLVRIPGGMLSLSRDVTDRRRLDEALARENAELDLERRRLQAVLEVLPVGVWIADADGRILDTNRAASEIWRGDTPMTRSAADYHREYRGWWAATGQPLGPGDWGLAKAVQKGESTHGVEIEIACFDGTRKTILNYAVPIRDAEQRVIGGVGLTVDITGRKHDERVQQVVAEASTVLGTTLDPDSAFSSLAEVCVQRFADIVVVSEVDAEGGYRRRAARHRNPELDSQGRRDRSRLFDQSAPQLFSQVDQDVFHTLGLNAPEQRVMRELHVSSLIVLPLQVRDRLIGALVVGTVEGGRQGFSQDDLELAKALALRAALAIDNARLYQAAQAASQAKSQFLATMSHELRTPLTAIIGYDELLLNEIWGPLTDRQRQQLERIRVSAWHLVTIIDQILTFSRAEAGRETVQSEPVNLTQLIQETTAMLEPQALAKRIELRVTAPEQLVWLRTDPGKVRQILLNLAGNAVKFTDFGLVEIVLAPGGDAAEVRIHDSGPGIPPGELERIFEPFTQLDQSNTRAQGGTGLGLTVSRRLARLLGGEVTVESRVDAAPADLTAGNRIWSAAPVPSLSRSDSRPDNHPCDAWSHCSSSCHCCSWRYCGRARSAMDASRPLTSGRSWARS